MIRYGSVCSGIEAATVAWHPLGWAPAWFAEIDPFPSAVLAHHYPTVPNLGDMTKITGADLDRAGTIDLLVGGTPCQSFSVAGLRKGMADPRGNLALEFLRLLDRTRARWVVWENVPGVLSSAGGRDFGAFLGALGELGYGWSYRVLDAQYFGVAQRRRRVFVVGHLGDWRRSCAVLLERSSLRGDPAPSREAGSRVAGTVESRTCRSVGAEEAANGHLTVSAPELAETLSVGANQTTGFHSEVVRAQIPFDASEDGTGRGTPLVIQDGRGLDKKQNGLGVQSDLAYTLDRAATQAVAYQCHGSNVGPMGTVRAGNGNETGGVPFVAATVKRDYGKGYGDGEIGGNLVAFHVTQDPISGDVSPCVSQGNKQGCGTVGVSSATGVRRLTPVECARLQGFPDTYLDITYRGKPACDGPKYKALGNSMAVPVMRWIGERIAAVEAIRW